MLSAFQKRILIVMPALASLAGYLAGYAPFPTAPLICGLAVSLAFSGIFYFHWHFAYLYPGNFWALPALVAGWGSAALIRHKYGVFYGNVAIIMAFLVLLFILNTTYHQLYVTAKKAPPQ